MKAKKKKPNGKCKTKVIHWLEEQINYHENQAIECDYKAMTYGEALNRYTNSGSLPKAIREEARKEGVL